MVGPLIFLLFFFCGSYKVSHRHLQYTASNQECRSSRQWHEACQGFRVRYRVGVGAKRRVPVRSEKVPRGVFEEGISGRPTASPVSRYKMSKDRKRETELMRIHFISGEGGSCVNLTSGSKRIERCFFF